MDKERWKISEKNRQYRYGSQTLKEGIKEKILRNVYILKNTEKAMLKRIRVSHNMTQEERQIDKELRLEARRKNEAETGHYYHVVKGPY